jgi:hypothetical protein
LEQEGERINLSSYSLENQNSKARGRTVYRGRWMTTRLRFVEFRCHCWFALWTGDNCSSCSDCPMPVRFELYVTPNPKSSPRKLQITKSISTRCQSENTCSLDWLIETRAPSYILRY